MTIKNYQEIGIDFLKKMPIEISNPEIFFGKGDFYLIEKESVYCTIKIEKKLIFKIGSLVCKPVSNLKEFKESDFLDDLVQFLEKNKICDILNPTLHFFMCNEAPLRSKIAKIGSLVVCLNVEKEEIKRKFSSNYKNEIKKVEKQDIEICKGENLEEYYTLYKEVQSRQKLKPYSIEYFKNLQAIQKVETLFWSIKVNDKNEGFVCVLIDGKKAYYLLGGAMFPPKFAGSNKLLQYEVMKFLKGKGVERYHLGGYRLGDIEGTKYKGIQSYKKRFGAEIETKYLFNVFVSPFKAKLYNLLMKLNLKVKGIADTENGLVYE